MIEYPIVVFWSAEDGEYVAEVPDLPYVAMLAPTAEEAVRLVREAVAAFANAAAERGEAMPEPSVPVALRRAG